MFINMLPKTWQELLDNLTSDSTKGDNQFIKKVSVNRHQESVIKTCLSEELYREKLLEWIKHSESITKWEKSASRASSFRTQGNDKFRARNNEASLALYTKSVIHAPTGSDELALALANRSADCLRDIDLAFNNGYPESLHYKLFLRRGQCLLKLGQYQAAVETLQQASNSLMISEDGKKSMLKHDVELALSEATELLNEKTNKDSLQDSSNVQVPDPAYGENDKFAYASAALELSCKECTIALYCSEDCQRNSWDQYHQWECHGGLELLHSVGIAHLGLRVVLVTGPLPRLKIRYKNLEKSLLVGTDGKYGSKTDNYDAVYHLMPHLEDMQPEDLFQYAMTAAMLTLYLSTRTEYFGSDSSEETQCLLGGLILRHIAQLVCNAHAITKLDVSMPEKEDQQVVTESQVRVATAIYPTASMMNHSCDPSIINSFHNEVLIVRACKDIETGGEVFNCYGPHFRHMGLRQRQDVLQSQYFFKCKCEPCSLPLQQDFQERFSALLCTSCQGPLIRNDDSVHQMVCSDCGHTQDYSSHVEAVFRAHTFFNEGCAALELGDMKEAIKKLESCWSLRLKCLYKSNKELTTCADQIAKCYAMLGDYEKSVEFLLKTLPAVEEQFGSHSVELANELQKLSDVMMCDLQTHTPGSEIFLEKHKKATEHVHRARLILELHYGKWNGALRDILEKEQQLLEFAVK
ncbi:hypothetical protein C0J52_11855 [Blattella germanica]|nr:hypothetical protein C0J52_11855 [Blattella germanica]